MRFFGKNRLVPPSGKSWIPLVFVVLATSAAFWDWLSLLKTLDPLLEPTFFCQFKKIEIEDILVCTRGARSTSKSTTAFLRTVSSPLQHNQLLMARGTLTVYREEGIRAFVRKMRKREIMVTPLHDKMQM